jgi:transposase
MRYDLTDFEWSVIEPLLPMDRRGPKLQNNRQGLYGIYRVLCAGASWRDLPERCGPLHHRLQPLQSLAQGRHLGPFDGCHCVGARRQGADDRQLDRAGTSHASGVKKKSGVRRVRKSRGGLTTKIHARGDAKGRPVRRLISPGNDHDLTAAEALLEGFDKRAIGIADKGYDADRVRTFFREQGAIPNIPNTSKPEKKPSNSLRARNARLAAITSLFRLLENSAPSCLDLAHRIHAIPMKKTEQARVG